MGPAVLKSRGELSVFVCFDEWKEGRCGGD